MFQKEHILKLGIYKTLWISGRLHFLLYINDTLKTINRKSKPIFFFFFFLADDTSIIFTNSNFKDFTYYIKT